MGIGSDPEPVGGPGRRRGGGSRALSRPDTLGGNGAMSPARHLRIGRGLGPAPLLVLALVLALLTLAACGGGAGGSGSSGGSSGGTSGGQGAPGELPDEEKVLHLFIWTEYMPDDVIRDFEAEYGVRVVVDNYSSNEEMLAKLQAGGQGQYDVVVPSDYTIEIMVRQGLLEPLDRSKIPNMANLAEEHRDPSYDPGNQYTVPYMWGTAGIAYNKAYVDPEPTSWADIWDPKYAGRIVLLDDSRVIPGMALQLLGYSMNETDPARLEEAKAKLLELAPRVKAYDSDSPKSLLISEEVWLGVVWSAEAVLAAQENPNIAYVLPREGGNLWKDNLAIPKDAPHPGWAHVFINYVLRPDVGARIAEAFPYGTPNAEALKLLPEEIRSNPAAYPPVEALRNAEVLVDVGDAVAAFDRILTEMKVAAGQ
nr:ABC transporter permease [Bacillota bacterium]